MAGDRPRGPRAPHHNTSIGEVFDFVSDQFSNLNTRLDALSKEFVVRRELEITQKDIDRAHTKLREIDDTMRSMQIIDANDRGTNQGRFTLLEKVSGLFLALVMAGAMAYLGLK